MRIFKARNAPFLNLSMADWAPEQRRKVGDGNLPVLPDRLLGISVYCVSLSLSLSIYLSIDLSIRPSECPTMFCAPAQEVKVIALGFRVTGFRDEDEGVQEDPKSESPQRSAKPRKPVGSGSNPERNIGA